MFGIGWEMVLLVIVLTLLGVFLTGPGMWSEKWGWDQLRRRKRATPEEPRAKDGGEGGPGGAKR